MTASQALQRLRSVLGVSGPTLTIDHTPEG